MKLHTFVALTLFANEGLFPYLVHISIKSPPPPSNTLDSRLGWRGRISYVVTLL